MLERVVEDDDIYAPCDRFTDPAHAIGSSDDGDSLVQSLVHDDLVAAVTPEHDRG